MKVVLVAMLAMLACASAARPALECVPASTIIPTDGSFSMFPKEFHIISSTQTQANTTSLATTVTVAQDFSVVYYPTYKVVTNLKMKETYVLRQCGTPELPASAIPAGAKVFEIPLLGISAADTTVIGFLNSLNIMDRMKLASSYATTACAQQLTKSCNLTGVSPAFATNKEMAQFNATIGSVDAVFIGSKDAQPKTIAFSATSDPGVLQRAEWVKFVAAFFNKEVEANKVYSDIAASYQALNSSARAAAAPSAAKPLVAFITNASFNGYPAVNVYAPMYKRQYVEDAGGRILDVETMLAAFPGSSVVVPDVYAPTNQVLVNYSSSFEEGAQALRTLLKDVDLVVDETHYPSGLATLTIANFTANYGFSAEDASSLKFLKNSAVYRFDGLVSEAEGLDWFETAVARPDLVLPDFVALITPSAAANASPKWLRKLVGGKISTIKASECSLFSGCKLADPASICPYAYTECGTGKLVHATVDNRCQPSCSVGTASNSSSSRNSAVARAVAPLAGLAAAAAALMAVL